MNRKNFDQKSFYTSSWGEHECLHVLTIHPVAAETIHSKLKTLICSCCKTKSRDSQSQWDSSSGDHAVRVKCPVVVEIFRCGPKWWAHIATPLWEASGIRTQNKVVLQHVSGGKENVSLAESLNQARLPIIDFKTCRQKKFWGDRVRDSMICAGFRDKEDPPAACQVRTESRRRRRRRRRRKWEWIELCCVVCRLFKHLRLCFRATPGVLCCASWGGTAGRCTAWWASAPSAALWRTSPAFSPALRPTSPGSRQRASGTFSCTERATSLSKHKLWPVSCLKSTTNCSFSKSHSSSMYQRQVHHFWSHFMM